MGVELAGSLEDFRRALTAVRGRHEAEQIIEAMVAYQTYGRVRRLTAEQLDQFDKAMEGEVGPRTWQQLAPVFKAAMALDAQVREGMVAFVASQRERLAEEAGEDNATAAQEEGATVERQPTPRRGRPRGRANGPGGNGKITDPKVLETRRAALAKAREALAAKRAGVAL